MKNTETITEITDRMCDRIDDIAGASSKLNELLNDNPIVVHHDAEFIEDAHRIEYYRKYREFICNLVDEGADDGAAQVAQNSLELACLCELSQKQIHRDEYLHEILSDITDAVYKTTQNVSAEQYADIVCDTFEKITNALIMYHSNSICRDVKNEIEDRQIIDFAESHLDEFIERGHRPFDFYE